MATKYCGLHFFPFCFNYLFSLSYGFRFVQLWTCSLLWYFFQAKAKFKYLLLGKLFIRVGSKKSKSFYSWFIPPWYQRILSDKAAKYSSTAHREIFSESCWSKPNLDCNYPFPIDLASIGIPIGVKSIEKG